MASIGGPRDFGLVGIHADEIDSGPMQPEVQFTPSRLAEPRLDHDGRLQIRRRRHQSHRIVLHRHLELLRPRLVTEHRDDEEEGM